MTTVAKRPVTADAKRQKANRVAANRSQVLPSAVADKRSSTDDAIATQLAPAVAIALLGQAEPTQGGRPTALEPIAAGAVASEGNEKLRIQLLFDDGAVLPVELTTKAAAALAKGIAKELPKGKG